MIQINVDIAAQTATPVSKAAIKAGGGIPITIVFSADPGSVPVIQLALGTQSSPQNILAYLDEFERENETTYKGTLDANDTRLIGWLSGKQQIDVNCEVSWTIGDDERRIAPNFSITAQPPLVTGPASSEGGPAYYTQSQADARYARIDVDGNVLIGTHGRLLKTSTGYTEQVSLDGVHWQDVETYAAS